MVSIGTYSLLCLILFIRAFCLFFFVSLAKGLSIVFVFLKNQFLVSLVLSVVFLVSILFISTHFYFLSYTDFGVCSSFSSFFRCQGRLFDIFLVS